MSWWEWVLIGLAGAVGAPLRYVIDTVVTDRLGGGFPGGTLVVNVSGSLGLGLFRGLGPYPRLPGPPQLILGTGLVGAYTTFSTFSFETIALYEAGARRLAARNVALSALAGAVAAAGGLALAAA